MKHAFARTSMAAAIALVAGILTVPLATAATSGSPGDATITVELNDQSAAGGLYDQVFELAYSNTTDDGTPVYVYVPEGALGTDGSGDPNVQSIDPTWDRDTSDDFVPCVTEDPADYRITQDQVDVLGDELATKIVEVDEAHFGEMGAADPTDPATDSLVTLAYNVQDDAYYDCEADSYIAGYFAYEYIYEAGMNIIVIDSFDWANRIGDQEDNPDGQSYLYEGVIAHELEHLLHEYAAPGEDSWIDEGLADFAVFLNGYDVGGSHLTYHQVFHRETSLTRWGGGLENYGASYTFMQYLWEQAGGNGDGTYTPDLEYDAAGGDLLVKLLFNNETSGIAGINEAIADFNTQTGASLRSYNALFKDWSLAVYLDDEGSDRFDVKAVDFGDPAFTRWTIDVANDVFWNARGQYNGSMPESKWANSQKVPQQRALPFGTSYETFKNPGPTFRVRLNGDDATTIAPHSGPTHWYGGFANQVDQLLEVDTPVTGGETLDFWTWYFIEEGWDYGFVQALVGGEWVTVPIENDAGTVITTSDDPHGNNDEGNGLTGTSGGTYFVDEPSYIHATAELPAGATDVRFNYSTDASYLDTGWFVDDVKLDGAAATLSSEDWVETTGEQNNNWSLQLVSPCDLTPGRTSAGELVDSGNWIYRFKGDEISATGFSSKCFNGRTARIAAVISNLPSGDLTVLDADYVFRVVNTSNRG